jgi:hypothetical protein
MSSSLGDELRTGSDALTHGLEARGKGKARIAVGRKAG